MRPVLSPASRRLWRDPQTLQLGRAPGAALVLTGVDESVRAVLALLDGTRDLPEVEQAAAAAGCPAGRARELVTLLHDAGLVLDAAERWPERYDATDRERLAPDVASLSLLHRGQGLRAMRRRDAAAVVVHGAGRVGAALAALLATAGVGTVDVTDEAPARAPDTAVGGLERTDLGRRRGEAVRDRLRELSPSTRRGPVGRPDLVVLAPSGVLDGVEPAALVRDGVAHLLAEVRDTVGVVGPLVVPGRSACLRCLDLVRTERDPDWPALEAQLAARSRAAAPGDGVLAAAVASQAALQVLALLDGGACACLDGSLELALPDWRWRRRSWSPHPACACGLRAAG